MVLSASIVFRAKLLASLRREINYRAFLRAAACPFPRILFARSQAGYANGSSCLGVSQTRLYKSVSPVIKRKYTPEEAKDNARGRASGEREMKNFRTSTRISCFSIFQLVVVYTSHFLDFSVPVSPPAAPVPRACGRNEFALGRAAGPPSLCNTLSSDISRGRTSADNSFLRVHYVPGVLPDRGVSPVLTPRAYRRTKRGNDRPVACSIACSVPLSRVITSVLYRYICGNRKRENLARRRRRRRDE